MDNKVTYYYEQLGTRLDTGKMLNEFYCEITGKVFSKANTGLFNRLVMIFGKYIAFFAVVDAGKAEPQGDLYPFLYSICANRFEREHGGTPLAAYENMSKKTRELQKRAEEIRNTPIVIPDSSDLKEMND